MTTEPESNRNHGGKRTRLLWMVLAGAVLLGVLLIVVVHNLNPSPGERPVKRGSTPMSTGSAGTSAPEQSASTPIERPTPEADLTYTGPPPEPESAQKDLTTTIDSVADALADPEEPLELTGTTGAFLEQITLQLDEWVELGWRQEGSPEVTEVTILEETDEGSLLITACIDSSKVRILSDSGTDQRGAGTPDRSLNTFTLIPGAEGWLVSEQSFPDDPEC